MEKINILNRLISLINEEIALYTGLSDLYETKRQVLIANDTEGLLSVDDKIVGIVEEIKSSVNLRKTISTNLGNADIGLSELVNMSNEIDENLADKFRKAQERVQSLIEKIAYQERVIRELLRHGLNMVSKTLHVISNTATVSGDDYTRMGKSTNSLARMSSVVTEV